MEHFPSLAARNKAARIAQAKVSKYRQEEKVVQHLLDTKPAILCCGKERWIDKEGIEKNMDDYIERFTRKGLGDRSERLDYLQSILEQKWNTEPGKFLSLLSFLLAMEDQPFDVESKVNLLSKEYSALPDTQLDQKATLKQKEENERLKKEILEEISQERVPVEFSSDSELSDWDSENEEESSRLGGAESQSQAKNQLTPIEEQNEILGAKCKQNVRKTHSAAWKKSNQEAVSYFKQNIRQFQILPLNQPVISSQVDLHFTFGKFWEWKKQCRGKVNPHIFVCLESDVIREILWDFVRPSTLNSTLFNNDWSLKSNLVVPSMTQASLSNLVNYYGRILRTYDNLKQFVNHIFQVPCDTSSSLASPNSSAVARRYPKIIQTFAHSINTIILSVAKEVGSIPIPFAERIASEGNTSVPSTLLQLNKLLREPISVLETLENLFCQCFGEVKNNVCDEENVVPWIMSLKIVSVLEEALSVERKPEVWRVILYLFSNCFGAFLEDFMRPLEEVDWPETCIFQRNRGARLSDNNFWTVSVTVRPYMEELEKVQVNPLSCLQSTTPVMITYLKILEMLRQLEENVGSMAGELPDCKAVVQNLLSAILPTVFPPNFSNSFQEEKLHLASASVKGSGECSYQKYFNHLVLSDRRVIGSFHNILKYQNARDTTEHRNNYYDYCQFEQCYGKITEIPYIGVKEVLPVIVNNYLDPIFARGATSLAKVLTEFKVQESITTFQEIILGAREDFAQAVLQLTQTSNSSSRFTYEDASYQNPQFQKLLSDCYPEGRENFEINFRLDPFSDLKCQFDVKAKFPLNILLTPDGIKKYISISQQLLRVRKSAWTLTNLRLGDCKPAPGLNLRRAYLLRFALMHFCSTLGAFFMLKIFSNDFSAIDGYNNFNDVLRAHEDYLQRIELRLLKITFMNAIIIKKMVSMSDALEKTWSRGITLNLVIKIEECLKQCWCVVNEFCKGTDNTEYHELYYHLAPVPAHL